jgi:hypothetical protein
MNQFVGLDRPTSLDLDTGTLLGFGFTLHQWLSPLYLGLGLYSL